MYKSVKDSAEYLGVSVRTMYNLVEARIIPFVKISTKKGCGPRARIVIDEKDLDRYARRNRVLSNEEFASLADTMLLKLEKAREDRLRRMR